MKDHGTEVIAGKKCRKVSVDEPVSAMTGHGKVCQ
jgi:hypothetical protein